MLPAAHGMRESPERRQIGADMKKLLDPNMCPDVTKKNKKKTCSSLCDKEVLTLDLPDVNRQDMHEVQANRIGDGRKCNLCPLKDTDLDPVMLILGKRVQVVWSGMYPDGKSKSLFCYYCIRVWQRMYRHKWPMKTLVDECSDDDTHKKFRGLCQALIEHCAKMGRCDSIAPWEDFVKTLTHEETHGQEVLQDKEMLSGPSAYTPAQYKSYDSQQC